MKKGADNKIRVRCSSCGKKLKYSPVAAGTIFHCPICHGIIVADLELDNATTGPAQVAGKPQEPPAAATAPASSTPLPRKSLEPLPAVTNWTPGGFVKRRNPAVVKLADFVKRDVERLGQEAVDILSEDIPDLQKRSRLREARLRSLARQKQIAERLMADLRQEADELRRHPNLDSDKIAAALAQKLKEIRELEIYLETILGIRLSEGQGHSVGLSPAGPT